VNPGDPGTEADIDAAARAGAPTQVEDTPPTQIIQVPDGGRVDS
jgi:cell division protease FtsH